MAIAEPMLAERVPWLGRVLDAQRGGLFHWAPVCLAIGIGLYFALRFEPGLVHYGALVIALAILALVTWLSHPSMRPIPIALALVIIGVLLAGARAHSVAGPLLDFRYYGPIEGRIVAIDRSASDKLRLTLDRVVLNRMDPADVPLRVRVSLHGDYYFEPEPGLRVMMTGHLSPPQGPVEPGGFDFRRMAWFKSLGAVGYTRTPALVAAPAEEGAAGLGIHRLRMAISGAVQEALPGRTGAFAAAVTTGDRSGMDADTIEALRVTNLAHLLAISGLHMGLLTGFVFAALRFGLACVPYLALRWPTKKIAAVVALAAGAYYYALSGGNVATERAFIMVSVMFIAVLLDRRAITLRAVAIAAILVLSLRPETLISPGFQMSFAATTALVAVFAAFRAWDGPKLPRYLAPVAALVISSSVAGLATAPVAAAHFNRLADYGLIANLLSVPMMGLVVMPGAVLAAVLAPLGLAWIGLALMKPGIDWILGVADWVAGFEGASTPIVAPEAVVLPGLALAFLWLILWRGRGRYLAVPVIAAMFLVWAGTTRPPLLIAASGGLAGALTADGRVLSKARGDGFTADVWLENDGDAATQEEAHARITVPASGPVSEWRVGAAKVLLLRGRGAEDALVSACAEGDVVIFAKTPSAEPPCAIYDQTALRRSGALAIWPTDKGLSVVAANDLTGHRLWAPASR